MCCFFHQQMMMYHGLTIIKRYAHIKKAGIKPAFLSLIKSKITDYQPLLQLQPVSPGLLLKEHHIQLQLQ